MKKNQDIVLVFCAHSDDQIFGPGGTLAKYSEQGKEIYTIVFSYGENSLAWLKREEAIKVRVEESRKADKIIGGSGVLFLGLKEGSIVHESEEKDIKSKLQRMMLLKKPVKIFTHSYDDPHPDHRAVYKVVMGAIEEMQYDCDVLLFDVWNPFNIRKQDLPKMYEDVTDTFSKKIEALKVFTSQKSSLIALLWSVYAKAFIHGFHIHKKYAERFLKIR